MIYLFLISFHASGEIVVNEVNFVKKCISTDNSQDDLWGKLICTNFKVSFIPQDPPQKQVFDGILLLYLNVLTYKNIDVTTLSRYHHTEKWLCQNEALQL